jgi:hypothetical protein
MNINWPNLKAAASASGNVLNMPGSKEEMKDFKALFASQLTQMWQDYRETGLTASEQALKAAGGEEALQAKKDLEESGSSLFNKDENTAEEDKAAKKMSTDTEIIRKYMPDGSFLVLTYQDGKIIDQHRTKPIMVEKPDLSRPTIIKNNGQEEYQTKMVPQKPLFGDIA